MTEQRPHLGLLSSRYPVQDREPAVLVELEQQIGRVVALHPRKHRSGLVVGALAQELDLMLVVELLEHVGLELLVLPDRLEDLLPFLV